MKFILIDGWADYSVMFDENRYNKTSPHFLFLSNLITSNGYDVTFMTANSFDFCVDDIKRLTQNEIASVIFNVNPDNINAVLNTSIIHQVSSSTNFFIFSVNENFSSFLIGTTFGNILFDECINYVENAKVIADAIQIRCKIELLERFTLDYSLYTSSQSKAIINTAIGCERNCQFCNVANSNEIFRPVEDIIRDIRSLLENGVKYFHIANHNLCAKRSYIEELCELMIVNFNEYEYIWSCYVIPEKFVEMLDLLPLMAKSKLKKIEISCESGSERILKQMGIKLSLSTIDRITDAIIESEIPMIAYHFLIGMQGETKATLEDTRKMIVKILDMTDGLADIYMHSYYPECRGVTSYLNDNISIRKTEFIEGLNNSLQISELNQFRDDILAIAYENRKKSISKIPLRLIHEYLHARYLNLTSQVYNDFLDQSISSVMYRKKVENEYYYYSWEISDKIEDFSPFLLISANIESQELKEDLSNVHSVFLEKLKYGHTVKELVQWIKNITNGQYEENYIINSLKELEQQDRVCFVQYFK